MPVSRCPSCELIITDEEARAGSCPVCAAPLPGRAVPPAAPPPPPQRRSKAWPWPGVLFIVIVLLTIADLLFTWPKRSEKPIAQDAHQDDKGGQNEPDDHRTKRASLRQAAEVALPRALSPES